MRLETLLDRLERATGPVAELAAQAMEGLALMYGTALARVVARAADDAPDLVPSLVDDELLHHLLALHGLHPQSARERVLRALEEIGPRLRSHGGDVELIEVKDEVARVRWSAMQLRLHVRGDRADDRGRRPRRGARVARRDRERVREPEASHAHPGGVAAARTDVARQR